MEGDYNLPEILRAVSWLLDRRHWRPVTLQEWATTADDLQTAMIDECERQGYLNPRP